MKRLLLIPVLSFSSILFMQASPVDLSSVSYDLPRLETPTRPKHNSVLGVDKQQTSHLANTLHGFDNRSLINPLINGMELKLSPLHKTINVELTDGEFLELRVPVPYFEPPKDSFILLQDIKSLQNVHNQLLVMTELPIQEYIQPATQDHIKNQLSDLKAIITDLEKRIYAFTLTEEELEQLKTDN